MFRIFASPVTKGTGDGPEGSAEDDRQQNANAEDLDRKALHVQSRSYWAPANIGPYSQAVSAPLSKTRLAGEAIDGDVNDDNIEQIIVHMAGQIPLVPSTMDLLDKSHSYTPELPALGVTDVAPEGGRGNELFIKQAALKPATPLARRTRHERLLFRRRYRVSRQHQSHDKLHRHDANGRNSSADVVSSTCIAPPHGHRP